MSDIIGIRTMEAGKLVTVAFLARYRVGFALRVTLVTLVAGVAGINGLGVFSQLVAAHLGDQVERAGTAEVAAAALTTRVEVKASVVADLDRRATQIDSAVNEMIRRGRDTPAGLDEQRKAHAALMLQQRAEVERLASLRAEEAAAKQAAAMEQAGSVPITYVAAMIGAPQQTALRWLILLIVLCADPRAIALTAAGAVASQPRPGERSGRGMRAVWPRNTYRPTGDRVRSVGPTAQEIRACVSIMCIGTMMDAARRQGNQPVDAAVPRKVPGNRFDGGACAMRITERFWRAT